MPRGGYRPRAGRKRLDEAGATVRVMINLTPAMAMALDAARGETPRGIAARELLLRALGVEDG